jgi:hypothetical protein
MKHKKENTPVGAVVEVVNEWNFAAVPSFSRVVQAGTALSLRERVG